MWNKDVNTRKLEGKFAKRIAFQKGDILHIHGDEEFSYVNSGTEPASLYVVLAKVPDPRYAENI